jgi:hypothetical protein
LKKLLFTDNGEKEIGFENNPSKLKKDSDIAGTLGIIERTVENIRKRFVLDDYDIALTSKPSEQVRTVIKKRLCHTTSAKY